MKAKIPWQENGDNSWLAIFKDGTIIDVWQWEDEKTWRALVIEGSFESRPVKQFENRRNPLTASRAALKYLKRSGWKPPKES